MLQNHAKLMLYQFLMLVYAVCKISARDLCILFYWIEQCGLQGEWDGMGLAPGAQTGKYQQPLDKLLPNPRRDLPFYKIKTPLNNKDGDRVVVPKRFIPAHSVLEQEMRERQPPTADAVQTIIDESLEWGHYYKTHPAVLARRDGDSLIYPVALYMDGVRYSRQVGPGRMQSVLLFTVYNLLTMRRHLLGIFHKSYLCKCGCRGFCSLYPFLLFLKWSFAAGLAGICPDSAHDGDWGGNMHYEAEAPRPAHQIFARASQG